MLGFRGHLRYMAAWGINSVETWVVRDNEVSVCVFPKEKNLVLGQGIVFSAGQKGVIGFPLNLLRVLEGMPDEDIPMYLATHADKDSPWWNLFGRHYLETRLKNGV